MSMLNVCETFESIQGESSFAGFSCFFIRLAGCNLRCRYCDTTHAYGPGADVPVGQLVAQWSRSQARIAEITGGEPLLQPAFQELALGLARSSARPVLVETNGTLDISVIPEGVVAVMDVKCPGSGESDKLDPENIARLRSSDEVKFVISDRADYEWARAFVGRHGLTLRCSSVFFCPAFGVLRATDLCGWLLEDWLPVRFQVQLHKLIGVR